MVFQNQILAGSSGAGDDYGEPGGTPSLWLAGDDVNLSGTDVTQWNDKSGNGFDATPTDAGRLAVLDATDSNFNDRPTLFFGGTSYGMAIVGETMGSFMTSATQHEWWFVGMQTASANYGWMLGDSNGYWHFGSYTSGTYEGGDKHVSVTVALSTPTMFQMENGSGGSGNLILRASDGDEHDYGSNLNYAGGSWLGNGVLIAGRGSGYPFTGDIAEILCYASPLTGDDLAETRTYLATKYDMEWS